MVHPTLLPSNISEIACKKMCFSHNYLMISLNWNFIIESLTIFSWMFVNTALMSFLFIMHYHSVFRIQWISFYFQNNSITLIDMTLHLSVCEPYLKCMRWQSLATPAFSYRLLWVWGICMIIYTFRFVYFHSKKSYF